MFFCEACRVRNGWQQSYGGSYGICEICKAEDSCYDVPSEYLPLPKKINVGVHINHCCQKHGCKYGYPLCPVGKKVGQKYMCEQCHEEIYEDGGWEDALLLNEMFNRGRLSVWKKLIKSIQGDWELKA